MQSALLTALTAWVDAGIPANPSAWLYRVAYRHVLGVLRNDQTHQKILSGAANGSDDHGVEVGEPAFGGEVRDELLRMLFVCCDDKIPRESQLVLALKTLCGFGSGEIAIRLFTTEANVYKRLLRARERLRESDLGTQTPPLLPLRARLGSVHAILYLLFNEGYLSTHAEQAIRAELCEEAIRLTTLLADHSVGMEPTTFALLALMHLHAARLAARRDATAQGDVFSRFHAEAGIAAEHCFSASFETTRWQEIADLYAMLERLDSSPIHTLNRAVAIAECQGPCAGLAMLAEVVPPAWLEGNYLWDAVLADLHHRAGNETIATKHRELALAATPSQAIRDALQRRLTKAVR